MSLRHSLFPCAFTYAGPATLNLTQMESFSVRTNVQKAALTPGGAVDRAHIGIGAAAPTATFGTRDLATYFAAVSISAGLSCTAATFRLQQRSDNSTFLTGANHETFTSTEGFLRPTTISASQDDINGALCVSEYTPTWDETNNPWVHNTGVNFDAVNAPGFVSRYFLGPVYHAGAQLDGIVSWSCDPGINYVARAFNGSPYPTDGAIITRAPTITFTTVDMTVGQAVDLFGSAISTGVVLYLQKGVASGTRVAAASSVHVKITAAAGDWALDEATVQGNDDGTMSFTAMPTGTIAIATNSTIP